MFLNQAKLGRNHFWRYLLVLIGVIVFYILGSSVASLVGRRNVDIYDSVSEDDFQMFLETLDFSLVNISSNIGFLLLLLMFIFAFAAFCFLFPMLHGRSIRSLITVRKKIDWKKIITSYLIWFVLMAISSLVIYQSNVDNYTFQFDWNNFIPLVVLSLFILPIQTTFEEFIFRGYLMQGFGSLIKSKWLVVIITSALFALIHSGNPEASKIGYWSFMSYIFYAGIFLAVMTVLDDSIEMACGIHAANNAFTAMLFSYEGAALETEAIFTMQELNFDAMFIAYILSSIVFFLCVSRLYNIKPILSAFKSEQNLV